MCKDESRKQNPETRITTAERMIRMRCIMTEIGGDLIWLPILVRIAQNSGSTN